VRVAAEEAVAMHKAKPAPAGQKTLILHPTNLWLTIHESVGHPTELDRALGYEANYAGTSFLTTDKLGTFEFGSKMVNIMADKTQDHALATCGYDDDGVKTSRWAADQGGVFVDYQTTRDQAHLIGQKVSHGCSYADSWASVPFQRMPNVSLEPGAADVSEQDIIAATDDGVFVKETRATASTTSATTSSQRTDVLGSEEWQDHDPAARSGLPVDTRPSSGSPATCSADGRRTARGRVQRRQGAAGPEQRGQPRLPGGALRAREHPEHRAMRRRAATVGSRGGVRRNCEGDVRDDLDTGAGQGADGPGAVVQQGGVDDGGAQRRRSRQPAIRAQHRHHLGGEHRLFARHHRGVRQEDGTVTTAESTTRPAAAMRAAEEIARLSPENPEAMPLLGPQTYTPVSAFFDDAAAATPEWRASSVGAAIALSRKHEWYPRDSSRRRRRCRRSRTRRAVRVRPVTGADYNLTARTPDGTGSGWASRSYNELKQLDPAQLAATAIDKAHVRRIRSASNRASTPSCSSRRPCGPARVHDLLGRRPAVGRGTQLLLTKRRRQPYRGADRSEKVRILSDPAHPLAPTVSFDGEGLPLSRQVWIDKGVLRDLSYSRFWAERWARRRRPAPPTDHGGGPATQDELIAGTERGVLVTRFWYIRNSIPKRSLVTGLDTRRPVPDREGKVTRALKEHALE
jgi:predicted Zn-dependent protease